RADVAARGAVLEGGVHGDIVVGRIHRDREVAGVGEGRGGAAAGDSADDPADVIARYLRPLHAQAFDRLRDRHAIDRVGEGAAFDGGEGQGGRPDQTRNRRGIEGAAEMR